MALICACAVIYSLPRFFEYRIDHSVSYKFSQTQFATNQLYMSIYKISMFFLVMYIIPMFLMTALNLRLIWALRKSFKFSRNERVVSTSQAVSLDRAKKSSTDTQQRNVTTIVVSIVILFVCCHIPAMTSHLFHSLHSTLDGYEHLECYRRYVSNVSNVLVNLNSACNFVIYCLFSQHFRKQFTSLMCKSCQQPRSALSSNDTTNGRNRDTVHTTAL